MTTLAVQVPAETGEVLTAVAATAAGDEYPNSGSEIFVVVNGSGGTVDPTFVAVGECDLGSLHDQTEQVAAGATEFFPGKNVQRFTDGETGRIQVTYDTDTSITVGVLKGA